MTLRRFRSIHEMKQDQRWFPPGDPATAGRMRYLWKLSSALRPGVKPRGIRKFRSIEEANAQSEALKREPPRR